jgi:glycosyltransferase involved in cell wall biosynthesis
MTIRVLMLGPGPGAIGGILGLTETIVPRLKQREDLLYFPTVERRPVNESGKLSFQNAALALAQYARFIRTLVYFRPQIIHVHTSQGLGWLKDTFYIHLAKRFHCKLVLHVHAADFEELYEKKSSFIRDYTRKMMRKADAVIAVSEEWAVRLGKIVPAEHVYTLKNCIAVDAIDSHSLERSRGARLNALFLGSVGRRKGAFDLLEAMGRLRLSGCYLQVWIAGYEEREGDLGRGRIRRDELQLGDRCHFLGTVRGAEKIQLLSKAGLFVLPSYNEGLPMAILEAMAAGLAVVSTPVGGIPEVVKDGYNGFLVNPGDVEALAEKLAVLACDPHLCEVMGTRSREIAERDLDVKPYIERLIRLYESIIDL